MLDALREDGQPVEAGCPYLRAIPADWTPLPTVGPLFRRESREGGSTVAEIIRRLALYQQDEAAEAGIRMSQFLYGTCRHRDVLEIGNIILRGPTDRLRPETLVHLWGMMASAHCHMGDFQRSLAFSEKAIELDDQANCTHKAPWGGADPAIVARDLAEMASRPLGNLDRSLAVSEEGMAIALERGHLFSIVWASVSRVLALTSFGRFLDDAL
jgi:hypothetical protein